MHIESDTLYHIYNQGNNRESTFLEREDYIFFLRKVRERVLPFCEIVNYCLMPNHFHFLVNTNQNSVEEVKLGNLRLTKLSNGFRLLTNQYTIYFNNKYKRTGSLFRQKTKGKDLELSKKGNYPFTCFHYIHQNPIQANLCLKMEEWEFSSFRDYLNVRNGSLITKKIAYNLIDISQENFYKESYQIIDDNDIDHLY
ncbi:transposase [Bernardetia sp.]|uniref:transposase n=1 Tax=Bernardetia sp. TaxID=1937974 RepID=UPI0025BFAC1C|nr:transposase [Bernardetia sp.]